MKSLLTLGCLLMLAFSSQSARADIELTTTAETETITTGPSGEKIITRSQATRVVPGSEVIYTITAHNTGKDKADSVVITNPVPEHTQYVDGSATGEGTVITFSVDGGKSFASANKLVVTLADGKTRNATAADYTHIRWVFKTDLAASQTSSVTYRVNVK